MGWFKRNLFFVIGVLVALALLGAAGFYDYTSWSRNNAALAKLNEDYNQFKNNTVKDPNGKVISPENGKTNNTEVVRDQERQLRQWISETGGYFQPIAPIPRPAGGRLTDDSFNTALHATLVQLQQEAQAASVTLPPASASGPFAFSFTAEQNIVRFAPGSLGPLSVELGEVKTISEIFFAAGINELDGIQRVPVSPDDTGTPMDYLADAPLTNDLAVLAPYQITFRAFSAEIARVLQGFAASPHGFIVTTVSVQPAGGSAAVAAAGYPNPNQTAYYNPNLAPYYNPNIPNNNPNMTGYRAAAGVSPAAALQAKGGLQMALSEQLLSVTLKVAVVRMTAKN